MTKGAGDDSAGTMLSRISDSVVSRPIVPRSDADRRRTILEFLVLHMRPVRVRRSTLRLTHTFGLGGMSLVLVALLMISGILLMLAYDPSPEGAYRSIVSLENATLFGALVRSVHHWSAYLLVAIALFHLLRVFFTGAYHGPRRFNWIIGMGLLAGILAANFTGYLLPWDQLSFWAVTICTGMLGYVPLIGQWLQSFVRSGADIGGDTLLLFFSLHTTIVPVILIVLTAFHFWRIRKARGVVSPNPPGRHDDEDSENVTTLPHLLVRELAVGLCLVAVVVVISVVFDAPLGLPANPGMSPNPAKAPWYFVGFQELQIHFEPVIAIVLVPVAGLLALLSLPYLRYERPLSGPWLLSPTGRKTGALAVGVALVVTPSMILLDEFVLQGIGGAGRAGFVVAILVLPAFAVFLSRKFRPEKAELVQALFILLFTALAVLTVTGVWFRGAGMALSWPGFLGGPA